MVKILERRERDADLDSTFEIAQTWRWGAQTEGTLRERKDQITANGTGALESPVRNPYPEIGGPSCKTLPLQRPENDHLIDRV
jgi:hypothetical protein